MTAATVEFAPRAAPVEFATRAATWELRSQVRARLEQQYLRLRTVERPALLRMFDADAEELDVAKAGRAIAITDYRIAALRDHLRTVHDPHPDDSVCPNCCVLLDRGDGPEWLLLAALPEEDLPLLASDSALARAVIGARQGQDVDYPTPAGVRTARVLALEYLD